MPKDFHLFWLGPDTFEDKTDARCFTLVQRLIMMMKVKMWIVLSPPRNYSSALHLSLPSIRLDW